MRFRYILLTFSCLFLLAGGAQADARLDKQLDLDAAQAQKVKSVQKDYRAKFSSKRGEFNRESRALRRARKSADSAAVSRQEQKVAQLEQELAQIRGQEVEAIRALLNPTQAQKYQQILEQTQAARGSSRDARHF